MQAIFASKMYKASKHKSKIRAALADPMNAELVQQLASYLDDEYRELPKEADVGNSKENNDEDEKIIPSESHPSSGRGHVGGPSIRAPHGDDFSDGGSGSDGSPPPEDIDDKVLQESSHLSGQPVRAGTCVVTTVAEQADSLKGLLNSREETAGVIRMTSKEDEIWIHYNDDTNLNNVMEPVIALLNAADYSNLQFNRLARTENAIVFSASPISKPVEPKEHKDE